MEAGGGHARELHDLRNLIVREAIDVLRADASRIGGLTGLFPLLLKGKERGLMFSPQTWTNGIALMANAHLAAASGICPCFEYPLDPPGMTPSRRDFLLANPIMPDAQGWISLSDAPGFGLEFDQNALNDTQISLEG